MSSKTVYTYNPTTFEYVGETEAQESPLEPGVFLMPANAVKLEPPAIASNEIAVLINNAWLITADFRGQVWFNQTTKEPVEITKLGQPAEELAATLPALTIPELRDVQKTKLELTFQEKLVADIVYMGATFSANDYSQKTLASVLIALTDATPVGFYWVAKNNAHVAMTFAQLKGLANAIFMRRWAAFQELTNKKAQVDAATSKTALATIV